MAFLAPLVLAGLVAVGAPIAIHLLNKMRVRRVRWAAMKFLQQAVKQNERKLKVEDLLLLLLRCLIVALLVFAFSRPVFNPGGLDAGFDSAARVSVILLDQSASMGQSDGARTRLDLAKAAVGKYLDSLGPGSRTALLPVTSKNPRLAATPGNDLPAIRRAVESALPSAGSNDWSVAIPQALEALKPFAGARREIVVFTDNQAGPWARREMLPPLLAAAPDVHVRLIPLGNRGENNLGIVSLKPESLIPAANQPFACLVEIANFGESPMENVRVTLSVDANPPSDEKLLPSIAAGASEVARLGVRFDKPGFHTVTATISSDRLPADDSRSLAVRVVDNLRVTIVQNSEAVRARDRDGFFVANALAPVGPEKLGDYFLKIRSEPPEWLETAPLNREQAILLPNVGRISATSAKRLLDYVKTGGALLIFPGPATDPAALNADLAELLPATLGPLKATEQEPIAWQPDSYVHPVTALWNSSPGGSLGTVTASRFFPLKLGEREAKTVVAYTDGSPAVAECQLGEGRVVLFSSTADTQWTNLPIHPNFVPLLRRLLGYVSQTEDSGNLQVEPGGTFQMKLPEEAIGRNLLLSAPGSTARRSAGQVTRGERAGIVTIRDTLRPGAYHVFFEGAEVPAAAFAVQVAPEESNLAAFVGDPLDFQTPTNSGDATASAPSSSGARLELWGVLLVLAGLVALVEMGLAHRFSLAK